LTARRKCSLMPGVMKGHNWSLPISRMTKRALGGSCVLSRITGGRLGVFAAAVPGPRGSRMCFQWLTPTDASPARRAITRGQVRRHLRVTRRAAMRLALRRAGGASARGRPPASLRRRSRVRQSVAAKAVTAGTDVLSVHSKMPCVLSAVKRDIWRNAALDADVVSGTLAGPCIRSRMPARSRPHPHIFPVTVGSGWPKTRPDLAFPCLRCALPHFPTVSVSRSK